MIASFEGKHGTGREREREGRGELNFLPSFPPQIPFISSLPPFLSVLSSFK
jgi:hypothetical protein